MKIRCDYVTNSSSSSFIVGFRSENDIDLQLKESMVKYNPSSVYRYDEVLRDIENHRITKEYALEMFKDEVRWDVEFYLENSYERKLGGYTSFKKWIKKEENKKAFDDAINSKVDELYKRFKEKIDDCEYLAEVEYCDHTDGDLEHEIMPYLDCTIKRFSHH